MESEKNSNNECGGKAKQEMKSRAQLRSKTLVISNGGGRSSPEDRVKLAAIAISLNVRLRSADMPATMQELALRYTRSLLRAPDHDHRPNPSILARSLKKEFDLLYGPAWHCVVGKSFGSFVTYSPGGFLYFSIDSLSILLFKTEVRLVTHSDLPCS